MNAIRAKISDKSLLVVLVGLCVVAATLVGVVFVNIFSGEQIKNNISSETNEKEGEYSYLYWDGMSDEERLSAESTERFFEVRKEAEELFAQDLVDVEKINKLYDEEIQNAKKLELFEFARDYVVERNEKFLEKNMPEEALNSLLSVDDSIFDYYDSDKYRFYSTIIEQAKELGREDIVMQYQKLREPLTERFEKEAEEIRKTHEEMITATDNYYKKEIEGR